MAGESYGGRTLAEDKGTVPAVSAKLTKSEMEELMQAVHPLEKERVMNAIRERRRQAAQAAPTLTDDEAEAAGLWTEAAEKRTQERRRLRMEADERDRLAALRDAQARIGLADVLPRLAACEERLAALEAKRGR